ncbi:hypothetical protein CALCODRAFT_36406 [Calocera cornea HHB12733]|uniref:Uncharacterized protein n=1 Tax=Calocera cornea HHB12733 TaxID=1353952 RepID=A0A165DZN2_9BASI|nr:hypothetical protein CALCODRAFT_36406 [Calocera cornea HHB12733]
MSSYQVTIDNTSPLLRYNGTWTQCFDQSGCTPSAAGASGLGESYHGTTVAGSGFSLAFSGDALELFGEYGGPRGGGVTIDNVVVPAALSTGNDFDSLITSVPSLSNLFEHTLSVVTGGPYNFTRAVISVNSTEPLSNYTVGYADPAIEYTGTWAAVSVQGLSNGTMRTNEVGASAGLSFTGIGVVVYSSLNNGHGPFNITLDGQTGQYTAAGEQWLVPETVVFFAAHLTPGPHTLVMTNNGESGSTTFTLNSIAVLQLASEAGTSSSSTGGSTSSAGVASGTGIGAGTISPAPSSSSAAGAAAGGSSTASRPNTGAIAGGVVGGVAALALLLLATWLFMRRRRAAPAAIPFIAPVTAPEDDEEKAAENTTGAPSRLRLEKYANSSSRSVPVLPLVAPAAGTAGSAETVASPSSALSPLSPKSDHTAVSAALATAGVGDNGSGTLLHDSEAANEVVDRVLELLAARIDPHRPGDSVGGTLPPPEYRDTRREG